MATFRQTQANQQNAQKSTGPTTEAGKARSRGNALKHGLTGEGVVLSDEQDAVVRQRLVSWRGDYSPAGEVDEWLFRQVVVSSVRIDQCQADEPELRAELATRASACWDDDRKLAADELGKRLAADPARVAGRMLRTAQGCQWLIDRWDALAQALLATDQGDGGDWTEEQEALALDLLGLAPELRIQGRTSWQVAGTASPSGLVMRELERLEQLRDEALDPLDELERCAAVAGRVVGPVAASEQARALERLRRQESACWRRFLWARTRLLQDHREPLPATEPKPRPAPLPMPAPTPAPQTGKAIALDAMNQAVAALSKRTQCDTGTTLPTAQPLRPTSGPSVDPGRPAPVDPRLVSVGNGAR